MVFDSETIYRAYLDCRRRKRGTANALRFELNLAENLVRLEEELNSETYRPSRSVCFVNERPKPREIFAADFRDRIVHHLFVREIEPYWEKVFIHDSYACRRGKGTHAAVDRLRDFLRSVTKGGRRRAFFLQMDVANFFMSIDKQILFDQLERGLRRQLSIPRNELPLETEQYPKFLMLRSLAKILVFNDPTKNYSRKSPKSKWSLVSKEKSLFGCDTNCGIPIGNLTSQFFGNVYLNPMDQFIKHKLKAAYYIRYVDDFLILDDNPSMLLKWQKEIEQFLGDELCLSVNPKARRLTAVTCGINFLGYVSHPSHRIVRRRVVGNFRYRLQKFEKLLNYKAPSGIIVNKFDEKEIEKLLATINSYLAHMSRASCNNLRQAIFNRHHWLNSYFCIVNNKVLRTWKPPIGFCRLFFQVRWFKKRFADCLIFYQIGNYYELFGKDARWININLGKPLIKPRFCGESRAGFLKGAIKKILTKTLIKQKDILLVKQTGFRFNGIAERYPYRYLSSVKNTNHTTFGI